MKPAFKIKLTARELQALAAAYEDYIPQCAARDVYELLELEHMLQHHRTITAMLDRGAKTYTLALEPASAVAFYIVWQRTDITDAPLSKKVVCDIIREIDKIIKKSIFSSKQKILTDYLGTKKVYPNGVNQTVKRTE